MFSGIVAGKGRVVAIEPSGAGRRLVVEAPEGFANGVKAGESICVSGVCLTHAPGESDSHTGALVFDVIGETLSKTTLGGLEPGDGVNLERSLRADGLIDGHIVQGHVEGVGEVVGVRSESGDRRLRVRAARALMECVTPKGSIAIEGVSLTVAAVDVEADEFEVALIPTTLEWTTLGSLREGSRVNLETDIVGRTVVHWARCYSSPPA